jgi:hypothetical protein
MAARCFFIMRKEVIADVRAMLQAALAGQRVRRNTLMRTSPKVGSNGWLRERGKRQTFDGASPRPL